MNYTDIDIARSLVNDTLDSIRYRRYGRSKAICCDDSKGKGQEQTIDLAGACLISYRSRMTSISSPDHLYQLSEIRSSTS